MKKLSAALALLAVLLAPLAFGQAAQPLEKVTRRLDNSDAASGGAATCTGCAAGDVSKWDGSGFVKSLLSDSGTLLTYGVVSINATTGAITGASIAACPGCATNALAIAKAGGLLETDATLATAETWDQGVEFPYTYGISVADNGTVYAGGNDKAYKSTDAGVTWAEIATGLLTDGYTSDIRVRPGTTSTVTLATNFGLFHTTDSGATWTNAIDTMHAVGVAYAPSDGTKVYASGYAISGGAHMFYRSTDGGATWAEATFAGTAGPIYYFDVHPTTPLTVLGVSAVADGLLKSTDGGDSWAVLAPLSSFGGGSIRSVSYKPTDPTVILVGSQAAAMYRSTDSGATWAQPDISNWPGGISNPYGGQMAWDTLVPGTVWAVTAHAVARSTDSGATWAAGGTLTMPKSQYSAIAVDPSNSAHVYAGGDIGVYRLVSGVNATESIGKVNGVWISTGAGAPEGACKVPALYLNYWGDASTMLYVCVSNAWVAK